MNKEIFFDEVFDAQEQFRIVLDAMAHPGKIYNLSQFAFEAPSGISNAATVISFSLLNAETSFYVQGDNSIENYISINTNALPNTFEKADYIFMNGEERGEFLLSTKQGTLSYPEDSATVIVDVEEITQDEKLECVKITFRGPGIETENIAYIKGLNPNILQMVKEINFEFPLGIDLIFTDKYNNVLGLPRSNNFIFRALTLSLN